MEPTTNPNYVPPTAQQPRSITIMPAENGYILHVDSAPGSGGDLRAYTPPKSFIYPSITEVLAAVNRHFG